MNDQESIDFQRFVREYSCLTLSVTCNIRDEDVKELQNDIEAYHRNFCAKYPRLAEHIKRETTGWQRLSKVHNREEFKRQAEVVERLLQKINIVRKEFSLSQ